ncbi:hypothetical protein SCHPADRAFT_802114, partial [Schizopora paradoxa]
SQTTDYAMFMQMAAFHDYKGVSRLIHVGLTKGASPKELLRMLGSACLGNYHVKSYSETEYEIQRLSLIIGGPKLAHTLSKALDLPSICSTQDHTSAPKLQASVGFPSRTELQHNINAVLNCEAMLAVAQSSTKRGLSILIDEIAVEEIPAYDGLRDAIIGFAREDASKADFKHVNTNSLLVLADRVAKGDVRRAKEATIVALASYGKDKYGAKPILISGTCKTETEDQQVRWMNTMLDVLLDPVDGVRSLGQLFSIASDGDATRRKTLHHILMSTPLSQKDPLYELLGGLLLMNQNCGPSNITMDIDYNHKFKNLATSIRGSSGFLVLSAHITPLELKSRLSAVTCLKFTNLNALFDPKDHQNVPKAVGLLAAIGHLADSILPDLEDAERVISISDRPFVVLGKFTNWLTAPFKTVTLSLSEQLEHLLAAAHLLLVLYRENRTSFCPGQLYYDIQTFVKNAFWSVAKAYLLD